MTNAEYCIRREIKFGDLDFVYNGDKYDKSVYIVTHGTEKLGKLITDNKTPRIAAFMFWLDEKYKKPVLTESERYYLAAVIEPWKERVHFIYKRKIAKDECITIHTSIYTDLPIFADGMKYEGMEIDKKYTLEELGLRGEQDN